MKHLEIILFRPLLLEEKLIARNIIKSMQENTDTQLGDNYC